MQYTVEDRPHQGGHGSPSVDGCPALNDLRAPPIAALRLVSAGGGPSHKFLRNGQTATSRNTRTRCPLHHRKLDSIAIEKGGSPAGGTYFHETLSPALPFYLYFPPISTQSPRPTPPWMHQRPRRWTQAQLCLQVVRWHVSERKAKTWPRSGPVSGSRWVDGWMGGG